MYDEATWRQEALTHCLWLYSRGQEDYAMYRAKEWERTSSGVLAGLEEKVRAAIDKHKAGERDAAG